MKSSKFTALVVVVFVALALPGCGRFAQSDAKAPTTTQADGDVGGGIARRETTTTAARSVPTTKAGGAGAGAGGGGAGGSSATTAANPACPPPPANSNRINHAPSEFGVGVIVSDRTCYGAREPFVLTLSVINNAKSSRFHDPNQSEFFEITGNGKRWGDRSCMPPQEQFDAPPSELGAGREAIFDARYPIPERSERSGDPCILPPGKYQVVGILEWCPPAANSDGFCSTSESQPIRTPPVNIRIG